MKYRSTAVRSVAAAAVLGLSLSTAGFAATPAFAQEPQPAAASTITKGTGSLTIHKKKDPDSTGTPTGEVDPQVSGTGLNDVVFTLYDIFKDDKKIDLKSNQSLADAAKVAKTGWKKAGEEYTLVVEGVTYTAKAANRQETTAGDGDAVFRDLPTGAYLVVESKTPTGYIGSSPFVAFIPMTRNNAQGNQGVEWNYDVHAYPKNYKTPDVTKKVNDKDQNSGDKVLVYTIEAEVRKFVEGEKSLKYFSIEDKIDEKLKVAKVEVLKDGQAFQDEGLVLSQPGENQVVANFTGNALAALKSGDKLQLKITTEVNPAGDQDVQHVPNQAQVFVNDPDSEQDVKPVTPKETPFVHTFWGSLEFTKIDKDDHGLDGAEFRIVRVADKGNLVEGNKAEVCSTVDAKKIEEGDSVSGTQNGAVKKTFVSDQGGKVRVTGLHVNDFENNAVVTEGERDVYCLVETKAPKGKELLSKAIPFQFTTNDVTGDPNGQKYNRVYKLATVTVGDQEGKVVNLDDTTPQLPLTGGAGVGILAALGALIIGAGAWFARRSSKQD